MFHSLRLPWRLLAGVTVLTLLILGQVELTAQLVGPRTPISSLAQLRNTLRTEQRRVCSYVLEGTVIAVNRASRILFLQDDSGIEALEVNLPDDSLTPGQRIRLQGINCVSVSDAGLSLGARPVVDNDGVHPSSRRSGLLYLRRGQHPIHVTWFNRTGVALLEVTRSSPNSTSNAPALPLAPADLRYRCFEGEWQQIPDFSALVPVKEGVTPGFDLGVRTRNENVGLDFAGDFEVPDDGHYTFYLNSDDGSQLFIHDSPPQFTALGLVPIPEPRRLSLGQPLPEGRSSAWSELDGKVTHLRRCPEGVELELTSTESRARVRVFDRSGELRSHLVNRRVRIRGLSLTTLNTEGRLVAGLVAVSSWEDVHDLDTGVDSSAAARPADSGLPLLTTAGQVQQLKRTIPSKRYPVKLRGIVTYVSDTDGGLVLQDETRAVFTWMNSREPELPRVGDYLEVEGTSRPGDFSPFVAMDRWTRLGTGQLPPPIMATWDQIISGSLDAQWIEVRGYVAEASASALTLRFPGGSQTFIPLTPLSSPLETYLGCVVRMRGCLFAHWEPVTHRVRMDESIRIGSSSVVVEIPRPADPFATDRVSAASLLHFNVEADYFRRVKVAGQILHGERGGYFVMDEGVGLRFQLARPAEFSPGDQVETVGLVALGGTSPLLHQAVARKTGTASATQRTRTRPGE